MVEEVHEVADEVDEEVDGAVEVNSLMALKNSKSSRRFFIFASLSLRRLAAFGDGFFTASIRLTVIPERDGVPRMILSSPRESRGPALPELSSLAHSQHSHSSLLNLFAWAKLGGSVLTGLALGPFSTNLKMFPV